MFLQADMSRLGTLVPSPEEFSGFRAFGHITKLVGLALESAGPSASIGDLVRIAPQGNQVEQRLAEVVGFRQGNLLLMPLEGTTGIRPGDVVTLEKAGLSAQVGEGLIGRVLDGLGRPIDGMPVPRGTVPWALHRESPSALFRSRIEEPFLTGVRSIDIGVTFGKGQRVGIFAGSGVGKSTLLGMICRNSLADINVIALIGERGKEVREFIEDTLGEEGMARSIVVVATSDSPALQRLKGAELAVSIAEYFRDQGANVLLIMDSLTRYSMAQREVGLSIGEPPTTKGYPPSVFAMMPKLLERAGTSDRGSITGIYTVLVEGDDMNDPIADTARSILDGHLVLSRDLANEGHYPPIDICHSVSRVMTQVTTKEHQLAARELKKMITVRKKAAELVEFGIYKQGSNPDIDRALQRSPAINAVLQQEVYEQAPWEQTWQMLQKVTS